MTLKCIIVDDEPIARKLLTEYLEETDYLRLAGIAENPLKAISLLAAGDVDLIFLDINMPKMNGITFLKTTAALPMVILTTAYAEYALDGFEMAVIDYLVKPYSLERFIKATRKALNQKSLRQAGTASPASPITDFFVKCDGKIERVNCDELLYAEAKTNYIMLHTSSRKLIVYLTIKGLLEKLPRAIFIQVHKSYLVNIRHVNTIEGNLLSVGADRIPVGLSYNEDTMNRLLKDRYIKRW